MMADRTRSMIRKHAAGFAFVMLFLVPTACSSPRSADQQSADASRLIPIIQRADIPLDSLFEWRSQVILEQPDDHPIGGPGDMALDSAGNIYLVDFRMKDVKSWTSEGKFRHQSSDHACRVLGPPNGFVFQLRATMATTFILNVCRVSC